MTNFKANVEQTVTDLVKNAGANPNAETLGKTISEAVGHLVADLETQTDALSKRVSELETGAVAAGAPTAPESEDTLTGSENPDSSPASAPADTGGQDTIATGADA